MCIPYLCMIWWTMWDILTVASFVLTTEGSHIERREKKGRIRIEAKHDNRNVCIEFYWVPSRIKQIAHKVLMICEKEIFRKHKMLSQFSQNHRFLPSFSLQIASFLFNTRLIRIQTYIRNKWMENVNWSISFQSQQCTLFSSWRLSFVMNLRWNFLHRPFD